MAFAQNLELCTHFLTYFAAISRAENTKISQRFWCRLIDPSCVGISLRRMIPFCSFRLFCVLFQSSTKEGFLTKRGAIVKVIFCFYNTYYA